MDMKRIILGALVVSGMLTTFSVAATQAGKDPRVAALAEEIRNKGWIVYAARSDENGTWDLFLSRPDGSQRRNMTNTANFEEAGPYFSSDSTKLLYRRFAKGTVIHHDLWGFQGELVIAKANGSDPRVIGNNREFPWASFSPDARQIACLVPKGIQIVDLATRAVVRSLPRKGIYQQLFWSPDGQWFCGVANTSQQWSIVRMNATTGALNVIHEIQSCTPDWCPNSRDIIYASRPIEQKVNQGYGYTQLWICDSESKQERLIYGEEGYHIYGGALSPDSQYVLFTRGAKDGGGSEQAGAPICVMRMAGAPNIGGSSRELRSLHPNTKDAPVLHLMNGWEPCWTYADIGAN
jgi:Tol biopolymer transport system component